MLLCRIGRVETIPESMQLYKILDHISCIASNYLASMSLDECHGTLEEQMPLDFLTRNQGMYRSKITHDPDTPSIKESLSGKYHEEFIEAIVLK